MTDTYHSSDGAPLKIAEMVSPHLRSAHAKLEREHPHRADEIVAMKAEIDKRAAKMAALADGYRTEGFSTREAAPGSWFVHDSDGRATHEKAARSEEGAWYVLAKARDEAAGL